MSKKNIVPHFNVKTKIHDPLPEFGGGKAILFHSEDRKRLAASFRESGKLRMGAVMRRFSCLPFDWRRFKVLIGLV